MERIRCARGAHQVGCPVCIAVSPLTLSRVFTWIFLLDTAFVIFNNLPPRMVIKEMKMHMATPEACFQAISADDCHQQIQMHLPVESIYWSLSFRGAFETLSKDSPSPIMCQAIADLGPLNLFALTSGNSFPSYFADIMANVLCSASHPFPNISVPQLGQHFTKPQTNPQHPPQLARCLAIVCLDLRCRYFTSYHGG